MPAPIPGMNPYPWLRTPGQPGSGPTFYAPGTTSTIAPRMGGGAADLFTKGFSTDPMIANAIRNGNSVGIPIGMVKSGPFGNDIGRNAEYAQKALMNRQLSGDDPMMAGHNALTRY